jgi:hypothetical protein
MKAYTDIEQSKKLAELLPIESADMYHFVPADNEGEFVEKVEVIEHKSCYNLFYKVTNWDDTPYIPCWSLAALLEVIPWVTLEKMDIEENWRCRALLGLELPEHSHGDNPIDACVEMIIKAHELNLL